MICYIITLVKLPMSMLFFVMLVMVIAMAAAADGDHQNDGYDNDALFSMTFPDDPSFPMTPLSQWV